MAESDFSEKIDALREKVGAGKLELHLNVHQAYAAAEHNRMYYRHPRGGVADFVKTPFEEHHGDQLKIIAEGLYDDLEAAATEAVKKFEEWVVEYAPTMSGTLKGSCNLYVDNNGQRIFEKEQDAPFNEKKAV